MSSTFFAMADSPMPARRMTRERITRPSGRAAISRGTTASSTMACISRGTPGTANTSFPSASTSTPGAVPFGLAISSPPSGTSACFRLEPVIGYPRSAKNRSM